MGEQQASNNIVSVTGLAGLNERSKFNQSTPSEWDNLHGLVSEEIGTLKRPNGIGYIIQIDGQEIRQIHQTNGARRNILVSTNNNLYLLTSEEFFGIASGSNLTPVDYPDEETMAKAIIVHSLAPTTGAGAYSVANTWSPAPLTGILSQLNPDGTAATFCTMGANQFTLAAGVYRITGWCACTAAAGQKCTARLFNVTTTLPLWLGLNNEQGPNLKSAQANTNTIIPVGGDITLAAPTAIRMDLLIDAAGTFGLAMSAGGFTVTKELYRWIEILKTL